MTAQLALPHPTQPDPRTAPALGWGILGPGWIASQFGLSLAAMTSSRVAAVGSRSLERSGSFARQYGDAGSRAYGSYAAVLADPAVDVAYVAVPHSGHRDLALQAIAAGKHVVVEKPLALDAGQAQEIATAARAAGVFAMEAMWTRMLPVGNVLRQVLEHDLLGQVLSIHADFGSAMEVDHGSRIYDPALGGGALLDLGVYPVALAALVSPANRVLHASGRLTGTGVDATFTAVIANADGSTASIFSSIEAASPQHAWIAGTRGTLELGRPLYAPSRLVLRTPEGAVADTMDFTEESPATGLGWEAAHVAWCLERGLTESPLMPLDESVAIARTMDDIAARLRDR